LRSLEEKMRAIIDTGLLFEIFEGREYEKGENRKEIIVS